MTVTLASPEDVQHFRVGHTESHWRFGDYVVSWSSGFVPSRAVVVHVPTEYVLAAERGALADGICGFAALLRFLSSRWAPTVRITAVDREAGTITLGDA